MRTAKKEGPSRSLATSKSCGKTKFAKSNLRVCRQQGLLLQAIVHTAGLQDRDGGVLLMNSLFGTFPCLLKLYADGGYQGVKFQHGVKHVCRKINVEIVKRTDTAKFTILSKRWVVERTIAWLNRCRRLAKNWECRNRNALAFLRWASIRMMLRRLCQINKSSRIDSWSFEVGFPIFERLIIIVL